MAYPNNYDTFSLKVDGSSEIVAADPNDLQDSVVSMQHALGLAIAGSKDTLADRLGATLNADGTLITGVVGVNALNNGILGGNYVVGTDLTIKQLSTQLIQAKGSFTGDTSLNQRLSVSLTSLGLVKSPHPIESTVAPGTAPFIVASTTNVANLNVDRVDGVDIAPLTNSRLVKYDTLSHSLVNSAVIESEGALSGLTSVTATTFIGNLQGTASAAKYAP